MNAIPSGFRLAADSSLGRFANGHVLVGGTPLRLLRLTDAGRRQCDGLLRGDLVNDRTGALARRLVNAGLAHPRPPSEDTTLTATIVIPVRDRPRQLDVCLQAVTGDADVIVVDDGSSQPAAIAAVCLRHGAEVVRLAESRGPSAARNAALPRVNTELVAFVDSDTAPGHGWLAALARHFADSTVGVVAPRIRPMSRRGHSALERYAAARSPLDMGPQEGLVIPYGPVPYVPTATMVVRRDALDRGFDEALRCGEDVDLVWRLHDAGWHVRYDPSVVVRHEEPDSWGGFLARRRWYGEWSAPLSLRHPGRLAHLVVAPLPTASASLLLARRPKAALALAGIQTGALSIALRANGVPALQICAWTLQWIGLTLVGFGRAATIFAAPVLGLGLLSRRTRSIAAALTLAVPLSEFAARRPRLNPVQWLAACVADDFAYGIGVLKGCARARTIGPLKPLRVTGTMTRSAARSPRP